MYNELINILNISNKKFSICEAQGANIKVELSGKLSSKLRLQLIKAGRIQKDTIQWDPMEGKTRFNIRIWI
jgi:hypothetical protein